MSNRMFKLVSSIKRAPLRSNAKPTGVEQAKTPLGLPVYRRWDPFQALSSILRVFIAFRRPEAWGHGGGMVPVWYRDGHYPEDATPKCSFLTTPLPRLLAEMGKRPYVGLR